MAHHRRGGRFDFKLGLDLSGGTHLVYSADTSTIAAADIPDALIALREVVERRVNAFGVASRSSRPSKGVHWEAASIASWWSFRASPMSTQRSK